MYNNVATSHDYTDDGGSHPSLPPNQDVGYQVPQLPTQHTTIVQDAKKLSLSHYDPTKMTWTSFAMKLHASMIECDLAYLLHEESTNSFNSIHSKDLMLELFQKLQGSAFLQG